MSSENNAAVELETLEAAHSDASAHEPGAEAETVAASTPEPTVEPVTAAAVAGAAPHVAATPEPVQADSSDDDRRGGGDGDEPEEKSAKDEFVEIFKTIGYALLIALVLRVLFFQPFTIPSASMEPNLYEGDYIIVSKWNYGYSKHSIPLSPPIIKGRLFGNAPERGDIVVFKLPRDNKTDYIKRVIGLPGDRIQMRSNKLYINDKPVEDVIKGPIEVVDPNGRASSGVTATETLPNGKTFTTQDFGPNGWLDDTGVYTVPAGHYFMMGDNRDNSIDSRVDMSSGVGLVPEENLVGKAQIILFSWSPGASLWNPVTWFSKLRPSRFFTVLQ